MRCPICKKKGELMTKRVLSNVEFYCWNCEYVYENENFLIPKHKKK